jgi:hypothetical protein
MAVDPGEEPWWQQVLAFVVVMGALGVIGAAWWCVIDFIGRLLKLAYP